MAVVCFAVALPAVDFFVAPRFAVVFLAAVFPAGARLVVVVPVVVFRPAFAAGARLAVDFFAAAFPVVFFVVVFLAVDFFVAVVVPVAFFADVRLAVDFAVPVPAMPRPTASRPADRLLTVARAAVLTAEALVEAAPRVPAPPARGPAGNRFFPVTTSLNP